MVLTIELTEGPSGYNSEEYDGYIFYQEMPWETPTVEGFGRGLMTRIPDKGYSGWMCYFNGEFATEKYKIRE